MARKFLYAIAVLVVLAIAAMFALRLFSNELTEAALVPTTEFVEQDPLADNAYHDPAMWFSRPGMAPGRDPARWQPEEMPAPETGKAAAPQDEPSPAHTPAAAATATAAATELPQFAVFFVHPTSYLQRTSWNAPLGDKQSQDRARLFVRGMASAFGGASEIWAPRYRQATFGAFLTDVPEAAQAIDAAYADVALAFDYFLQSIDEDTPIVLAGHSQGALHILRLLRERVAGTPLEQRVAMAYPIGWPTSVTHDLPALGLPACESPEQAGCIVTWTSFAEPPDPGQWLEEYGKSTGFDGEPRGESPILCVNPLTGTKDGEATAEANLGTLVPNDELTSGTLVPDAVPARCSERGLLLIGDPPDLGPYVLPGNNYHVYDIPLFWANLKANVERRVRAWAAAH